MVRQQDLSFEMMDECLNSLQNTQTATSLDLPAKWAQYGQNSLERGCWDMDSWAWDSNLFVARPTSQCSSQGILQKSTPEHNSVRYQNLDLDLGLQSGSHNAGRSEMSDLIVEQTFLSQSKRFLADEPAGSSLIHVRGMSSSDSEACLALKLGGETYAMTEENRFPNGKRCRVGSPASSQSPVCQVDNCGADLSNAKDYHRRHRVCEVHAKANKAPVGRLMQRFCQQCSRFHLLQEFDEGKRSCRRRLAGHNKRRRKTQPDATSFLSGDEGATRAAGVLCLINFLYQLQALRALNSTNGKVTDLEWLLQLLTKANLGLSEPSNNLMTGGRIASSNSEHLSNSTSPSDQHSQALLAALANINPEALSIFKNHAELRREEPSMLARLPGFRAAETLSNQINQTEKNFNHTILEITDPFLRSILQQEQSRMLKSGFPSIPGPLISSDTFPLSSNTQLKNKIPDTDMHFEVVADVANLGSCNLSQTKRLDGDLIISKGQADTASPDLVRPVVNLQQLPLEQKRQHSDSASDNSSEEDTQEWTGRIVLKLFDRTPDEIPQNIRSQIIEWLYQMPTHMESYIRPGCIVLCIFISMHKLVWKELLQDLQLSLKRLLHIGNCPFWNEGRIFVHIGEKNAIIIDGEVHTIKFHASANLPQLISVQPLAVVAGEETKVTVKGHNLTVLGTSIFCAYNGKCEVQEVLFKQSSAGSYMLSDNQLLHPQQELCFILKEPLNRIGRCFIEVERFAIGDFFPLIIADRELCAEIRSLEKEIECSCINGKNADEATCGVNCKSRVNAEAKYFLNELGWLFHLKNLQMNYLTLEISTNRRISFSRFKCLLQYAVDHDWCAVLKKLLDLFFTIKLGSIDSVLELGLLHAAVKRKCRPIVDMLLAYEFGLDHTTEADVQEAKIMTDKAACRRELVFRPNFHGPAGLTPLHIAASMQDAEDLVDALTNDLAQVGVEAWNSCQDAAGQTPSAYALLRGYKSYINLVEAKMMKSCRHTTSKEPTSCTILEAERQNTSPANTEQQQNLESCGIEMPVWSNFLPRRLLDGQITTLQHPCRLCRAQALSKRISGVKDPAFRPFLLSMVAVAAVCVCVCVVLKGPPDVSFIMGPFIWESVGWGYM